MNNIEINPVRISFAVSLLSVSLIAYQLLLIQILSIVQWYHFAYMMISVALLGFGAAGTFLSLFQKHLTGKFRFTFPFLLILTSVLMPVSVSISQTDFLLFDSYRLFMEFSGSWKLAAVYLVFFLPFFTGALAIGLVFIKNIQKIGSLYFSNMTGSGMGGVAAVILMWFFFPERISAVIALLALCAGLISLQGRSFSLKIFAAAAAALILFVFIYPAELKVSQYKSLSKTLNLPETSIIRKESSPYGLLHLISSGHLRYAPGLSITYPDRVVVNNAAFKNGEWAGALIRSDQKDVFRYSTGYLPYAAGRRNKVLILDSGTGANVKHAVDNRAESITAVEPDENLLKLLLSSYAGLIDSAYNHPDVHIKNIYSRSCLLSGNSKYDLIQLPSIDAFGGTSGLYAVQEQYLLTKDALGEMYSMLTENGVICISAWIDYPYKNPLKIIASAAEALYEKGIENITARTAAVKNWNMLTIIVGRRDFLQEEIDSIRSFCRQMKFDPVLLPGVKKEERDFYNKLQDKSFYSYVDRLIESQTGREEFYSDYLFDLRPPTDNKPYFSQFLKWNSISRLKEAFGAQSVPFFEVGYILLYVTLFQILIIAVILIILPLFKIGWRGNNKLKILFYFGGLGLGYMFIEIVLIQKFILYFGNIIYAAAAVVSLMLIASGLGSLYSQKINDIQKWQSWILLIIPFSIILYLLILTPLIKATIIFPLTIKILFAGVLIVPAAFFMGMPFPLGMRLISLNTGSAGNAAWAWGINGVFSVTAAVLAAVIALELGFIWVMLFAAAAYLTALGARN